MTGAVWTLNRIIWGLAALAALFIDMPALGQLRVVNYNIAQLQGNAAALEYVFAEMHADDRPGFAVPVSVFVFQEVKNANVAPLLNLLNAAAPPGITYVGGTYTNSNEDGSGGAQAIFFRSDMLSEHAASHVDIFTQAGRNADRWRLLLTDYSSTAASLYVYSSHLKSDTGATNEGLRLQGVTAIRNNANALGAGWHIIYCGDQNFYHSAEPGYLHYFGAGNGQAFDPLGTGSSWAGSANAIKHTQSPLLNAMNGLIGGGMDDRFDFQLPTSALNDFAGLSVIPGTYRAMGNDGLHYNLALDSGNNSYFPGDPLRSMALADNLTLASDHVPVIVDYQLPARMAAVMAPNYGRVIQDALFDLEAQVTNPADVVVNIGADVLDYNAVGSLGLSGNFADSVEPAGDVSIASFPLNTTTPGTMNGRVTLTSSSQGVQPALLILNTTGTIVRPSNASFSDASDVDEFTLPLEFEPDTGVHYFSVDIHNFEFDSLQALLDIDSVSALSNRFAYLGGASAGIGDTPATLDFSFDTTGLARGRYVAPVDIAVSDEDIPGEAIAALSLTIQVTLGTLEPCDADITGDRLVNVNDLLVVIAAWGPCPAPPASCPADINDDTLVNVNDLLAVISAWGACP